ncbi:RuBisCO accumulation factor 1 [Nodosilinea sp. E11]|uniref:RuBisCO accumulation factor 1 n=1 Tax=Nodosilinea sp. E11 TaxID=3037479 RepID=UPI0029351F27|nr:RuBisCO accumulation factor 1 [Nodosilinea sp. E11]WOD37858.1 RuBisCO accumulation factor 1 [Nodosilinea sp. E11]
MVSPGSSSPPNTDAVKDILLRLRRKEGTWVDWAQGCQALQKAGFNPHQIFEETGFEPIQQNQIVVAEQVYQSLLKVGVAETTKAHFTQQGSDSLYELRILSQADRASTADFALQHGLDSDAIRDLVKPIKEYSYRKEKPPGFGDGPGDAIAYHFWKLARQKDDLQDRSRLIAQGLRFAESPTARQQIEKLLTDFTVDKSRPAPRLPLYRLESESDLPRVIPVVGQMPLTVEDFKAVPVVVPEAPFGMVAANGASAWIAVPGWQVIFRAEDPVGLLTPSRQLPNYPADAADEVVLAVIDRSDREWSDDGYFLTAEGDQLALAWSPQPLDTPILGKMILILRPKRILDEDYNRELWQLDE